MSTKRSADRGVPRLGCLAALLAATVLCAMPSVANAAADCFVDSACSALVIKGKQAHNEHRYIDALRFYQAAYEKAPDPRLLILRGRTFFKQGQPDRALDLYRAALPQLNSAEERRDAGEFIRQAEEAERAKPQGTMAAPRRVLPAAALQTASGAAVPGNGQSTPVESRPPIYKRWWFWTLIGVAAAGVATGVGLGVAAREPDTTGLMEYRL